MKTARAYLLDTNHLDPLFRRNPLIVKRIENLPQNHILRASVISIAEVEVGLRITECTNETIRNEYRRFINEQFFHYALHVTQHTVRCYSDLICKIWENDSPNKKKKKTERHLFELGVDINDVWIASIAIEHGMILVTTDKMDCIKKASRETLRTENWLTS